MSAIMFGTGRMVNVQIPRLTPATRPVSDVLQKENPASRRHAAMQGDVNKSKFLLPKVSI